MLNVTLVSKEGTFKQCDARAVVAPSVLGEVGILPGHATYLTVLGPGEVRMDEASGEAYKTTITGGFMEVRSDHVTIIVDSID